MAAGNSSVHCWPTDDAQDVIKTLRSRGCCSIGQRLMLGSKRLEAFQSLADSGVQDGAVLQLAPADGSTFIICMMVRATRVSALPLTGRCIWFARQLMSCLALVHSAVGSHGWQHCSADSCMHACWI